MSKAPDKIRVNGSVYVRADVAAELPPELHSIARTIFSEVYSDSREIQRNMVQKFFGKFMRMFESTFPTPEAKKAALSKAGHNDLGELALDVVNDMITKAFAAQLQLEQD